MTEEYYQAIDAYRQVPTLDAFRAKYFLIPAREVVAYYYNAADLGFGREMHCQFTPLDPIDGKMAACYVSNYGFDVGPEESLDLLVGHDLEQSFATVAMVYVRVDLVRENPPNPPFEFHNEAVVFYLYAPDPDHEDPACRVPSTNPCLNNNGAQLDSQGLKPIPQMCMSCHAGRYFNGQTDPTSSGSAFLPFNVFSFLYSDQAEFRLEDQQEAFRKLNDIVRLTRVGCGRIPPSGNVSDAICDFVTRSYSGRINQTGATAEPYVPEGWASQSDYYSDVVLPYCGSCHLALEPYRDWASLQEFAGAASQIHNRVCLRRDMPHAQLPWENLWQSDTPHIPDSFHGTPIAGLTFPSDSCSPN